jgi:outer membrane protein assembly factor BamA
LLDDVKIKMEDKGVNKALLMPYIQQKPNTSKLGVKLYSLAGNGSGFIRKFIRKIGEEPVIFSNRLMNLSTNELTVELQNLGYLNAQVTAHADTANKKATVVYTITNNEPYRIRNYKNEIPLRLFGQQVNNRDTTVRRTIPIRRRGLIREGSIFDMNMLERERTGMNELLRNRGYYASTINNLRFWADTALQSNQVDLTLSLLDTALAVPYKIKRVNVYSGYDPLYKENYKITDSIDYNGINIYYNHSHFLRPPVIYEKIMIYPDSLFRERNNTSTLSLLRAFNCVNLVNMQYAQGNYTDSTLLDCNIYLSQGNIHSLQVGLEGTNKAGDLGMAMNITYGHLNLFNGAEQFNMNVRAAYEFVNGVLGDSRSDHNYYELNIKPSLIFNKIHLPFIDAYVKYRFNPQTQYGLGYNIQQRPEYTRNFFNFNWKFRWTGRQNLITHTFSLLDINYVSMSWKSDRFRDYLDSNVDYLTKYSYNDIFIAGTNYSIIYTNTGNGRMRQHLYSLRFGIESSGYALSKLSKTIHKQKNVNEQYTIFGNPFAQYFKGDIDLAHTFQLDEKNGLAFHAGMGVAFPYGNSQILPFEKRYYAGGPNSVRGWSTRYLGPGAFCPENESNLTARAGDVSLILSAEYRFKWMSWLEPAFFIDCGNIWTVKDYKDQPDGMFRWNKFYKELATGAGFGLRLDLSVLIFRIDAGAKVYDPSQIEGNRFVLLKNRFVKNMAIYAAIGYPF